MKGIIDQQKSQPRELTQRITLSADRMTDYEIIRKATDMF
jgi:hypothetical protein